MDYFLLTYGYRTALATYQIAVFFYLISLYETRSSKLSENRMISDIKEDLNQHIVKNLIKRSADWSKRISSSTSLEVPRYIAAESENVELSSKPPRIIRRLRIQHGGKQSVEVFKEINPENRSNKRISKIVKVKKIKRKSTLQPVVTTSEITTTTRKPKILSSTSIPKITLNSPYSHITVINKETRNPKINKKNKKKRKYQMFSTASYDAVLKGNGVIDDTNKPQYHLDTQREKYKFNSYPHYEEHNNENDQQSSIIKFPDERMRKEQSERFNMPRINSNTNTMIRTIHPLLKRENQFDKSFDSMMSIMDHKAISPRDMFIPYKNRKNGHMEFNLSEKGKLQESSSQLEQTVRLSETNDTQTPPRNESKVEIFEPNIEKPLRKNSSELDNNSTVTSDDSIANRTENSYKRPASSEITTAPTKPSIRTMDSPQKRFPTGFPSLFGEQNAFSDPFFDTPDISPQIHRGIMSWNHQHSPFYTSDNSPDDHYFSDDEIPTYPSDGSLHSSFRHGPQFVSLRRTILDGHEEETTTSEPVTPFSLPKFEIPSIDFNDKGCRTIYKEIKTVPADGTQTVQNNGKSLIMSRECYFPNGVPTTEQTKDVTGTEASMIINAS